MNEQGGNEMGERSEEELGELLALAAVDALNEDELADVDAAVAKRDDLRTELADLRAAAAAMATAVAEAPPVALRARVLAAARHPQEPPVTGPSATAAATPTTMAPSVLAPVVPIAAGRRRQRWLAAGAMVAAAAAAVVGVLVVRPFDGDDGGDPVAAVVEAEDARTLELDGELTGLRLVHSAEADATVLIGEGVQVPVADKVYELWVLDGPTPTPVEIFRPAGDGRVAVVLAGVDPGDNTYAITVEPAGGSEQPTGDVVAMTV